MYCRVDWIFLCDTLKTIIFSSSWIDLIMNYINVNEMKVLWNVIASDPFSPSRGIWQGDPIFSYLFVLYIERLSHMILDLVKEGSWKPLMVTRTGPSISHFFFADDIFVFAEVSVQ